VAIGILILLISCGAIAAGANYARTARRMRSYRTTSGTVISREVAASGMTGREGRWGRGGGYQPVVTYTYSVDGTTYTADRWSYATDGLKQSVAQEAVAAVPDEVDVHYDPADPRQAYLHVHTSRLGYALIVGGVVGVLVALTVMLG
jgi:Protein of unknown function (DUF3592)